MRRKRKEHKVVPVKKEFQPHTRGKKKLYKFLLKFQLKPLQKKDFQQCRPPVRGRTLLTGEDLTGERRLAGDYDYRYDA